MAKFSADLIRTGVARSSRAICANTFEVQRHDDETGEESANGNGCSSVVRAICGRCIVGGSSPPIHSKTL
jgi:hypothetical protein